MTETNKEPIGPAIQADNLSLVLGHSPILSDMSFRIEAGTVHCFIGPNGGGKTCTLRCLLGQMPHKGNIRIEWTESDQPRTIGYVPQLIELQRSLPLTINDFLVIVSQDKPAFMGLKKQLRGQVDEALEKVGLADKRKFMIGSLSGGERQRLLFAQALLPAPSLLVLDEPMTSMDESGIRVFEGLVDELHKRGVTILWVNHDLPQVKRVADTITVIDRGLIAHGPVDTTLSADMLKGIFKKTLETAEALQ